MEDVLAVIFIFGGGLLIALAFSPFGKAVADRFRFGKEQHPQAEIDPGIYEELESLRNEMTELQERVDFAERLLAKQGERAPELKEGA